MKVLVFDVFGKYALFRRSYTTTSSTSYCFPTRTAICGLLGAILGIRNSSSESSEHLRVFDDAHFAVKLLKPIRKINIATNYTETKSGKENPRTQILLEMIKDPAYRIYVSEFERYEELKHHLQNKINVFTPYLGQAQMIRLQVRRIVRSHLSITTVTSAHRDQGFGWHEDISES